MARISSGPTRNDLMLQAKAKGIKNFRILNKAELEEVLREGASSDLIARTIDVAVARWKAGWGKGKKHNQQAA